MIADGLHARTDGLTSLAVLIAVFGVWIGVPILDPIIGLVIGLAIVGITWDATKSIWYRLMDAVNPELVRIAEATIKEHDEVADIQRLQLRWVGHRLHGEAVLQVKSEWTVKEADEFVKHLKHHFEHVLPNLGDFTIQFSLTGASE
jgi:cation diffusion facilitator family transporter